VVPGGLLSEGRGRFFEPGYPLAVISPFEGDLLPQGGDLLVLMAVLLSEEGDLLPPLSFRRFFSRRRAISFSLSLSLSSMAARRSRTSERRARSEGDAKN